MTAPRNERSSRRLAGNRALVVMLVMIAGLMSFSSATADADEQPPAPSAGLHPAKQTTLGLYVTAREAYEKWKAAPGRVTILDVRTPEEFMFVGHADMALNVPVW